MSMGMEMMLKSVFKALNIDGEQIISTVANIATTIKEIDARMTRIENKLDFLAVQRVLSDDASLIEGTKTNGDAQC